MSIFVRSVAGIVLVIGLLAIIGCSTTQSDKKTTNMNIFPWQREEKEPDKPTSVGEFIGRDRVTIVR